MAERQGSLFASATRPRTVAHRGIRPLPSDLSERGVEVVFFDREKAGELVRDLRLSANALIDSIAFGREHARQLIEVQGKVGTFVVISSSNVYRDALSKTLDEAPQNGFPEETAIVPTRRVGRAQGQSAKPSWAERGSKPQCRKQN